MVATTKRTRWVLESIRQSYVGPPVSSLPAPVITTYPEILGDQTRDAGGSVPGWRQKIRLGNSATTPLSGTLVGMKNTQLFMEEKLFHQGFNLQLWRNRSGNGCCFPALPTPGYLDVTKAMNQAKRRFINQARAKQTALLGGVVLGELRETLRLIKNPARLFRNGLDSYHKAVQNHFKRYGRKSAGRFAADSWLQNSFGWQPLIRDIEDGARGVARLQCQRLGLEPIVAYGRDAAILSLLDQISENPAPVYYVNKREWQENLVILRGAVRVKTSSDSPAQMAAQNFGFTAKDFVPTIWELIPYSFLVDYFTNIGDILSAWSFGNGDISWSCQTVVKRVRYEALAHSPQWTDIEGWQNQGRTFIPGSTSSWRKSVERGEPGSFIPQFEWSLPDIASTKWLNIAALARLKTL